MAEKPSELNIFNNTENEAAGANRDSYLGAHSDEYPLPDIEIKDTVENTGAAPEETDQLKAQIEETRSQMSGTIDAIQEKLSYENISEQVKEQVSEQIHNAISTAKETVYDAVIGNVGKAGKFMQNVGSEISKSEVGKYAKKNPFPLVLIGLGAGLLAYELSGKKKKNSSYRSHGAKNRQSEEASTVSKTLKSASDKISDTASSAYESVSSATGSAIQTVGGAANSAYEAVSSTAGTAYEKVGEYGSQARDQYDHHIEENPLAVGAIALAVGAAVGFAIPATRYESEMLGEYRQQLLDKAQDAAGNLVDKAKELASQAQETVTKEVKKSVDEVKQTFTDAGKDFDSTKS